MPEDSLTRMQEIARRHRNRSQCDKYGRTYREFCHCSCHRRGAKHVKACCTANPKTLSEWPQKGDPDNGAFNV